MGMIGGLAEGYKRSETGEIYFTQAQRWRERASGAQYEQKIIGLGFKADWGD